MNERSDRQLGPLDVEENQKNRVERLGRQRPEQLASTWRELIFVFSLVMSQALTEYFISGFTLLIPSVTEALHISPASATWPASSFSLVVSGFLLPFGRIADIYGGYPVYLAGLAWYLVWSVIAGFSRSQIMLDVCRALQGLGPAAYLPAGLTLLGNMYRPGPRKNIVFSIYGAMAPFGFFAGFLSAGISAQYAGWQWFFWIGAMFVFVIFIVSVFSISNDMAKHRNNGIKMDWLGSITIIIGLILLVFAITDSSGAAQGWRSPYIGATLALGLLMLSIAIYIEGWVAEQPLIPPAIFKIPSMVPFMAGLFLCYGTLGIFILYASLYSQNVLQVRPMQLVAWSLPLAVGGCTLAICGGFILHIVPPKILMLITGLAIIVDALLFALAPADAGYWPWIFPAMCCATIAIDLIFNVANIFLSTSLAANQQGFAGAVSNVLLQLSIAVLLGFADVIVTNTAYQGQRQSYKNAFWFEMACGAGGLLIFMLFVSLDKAKSDLTADEKEALRGAGTSESTLVHATSSRTRS